jgi:hypothetical protein
MDIRICMRANANKSAGECLLVDPLLLARNMALAGSNSPIQCPLHVM